ncbi:restriction endonuclease subunit S [Streptococcus macedonicus]|uniref:Restriction endonuclease subunit S n=2 Tax=Streptococcus macedonicus TaxID=59310 RepID=A0A2G3NYX4_STRMC|nr:restriction endonuclease subunit S [Streptococcus macedonicus]
MDLPTLTISAANGWMDQKERFSGNIAGKEQKNYTLLHKGELSYNHGNSKLAKYGAVFSLETYEEALVPRVYHSFKVINGSPKFIEYYFATKIPDRELAKLVSSGARMDGLLNINFNEFMGINLTVPNKSEQEKISNYFSNLDRLITLHQRECDLLAKMKKSYLQKMFPKNGEDKPEIRFAGFTDAWEQRKLGDISKVIDPHPSHRAPAATEKGIPFIGISDVDEVGNINHKTARIVDEKIFDEHHNRYDLSIPSIGIGRVASLGKVIRLRNDLGKYAVSPTMSVIQFTDNNDLNFLYSNMNTPIFQKQFKSFSNGSTRQSVGIQDLRTLMVSLPIDIEEQKQIGSFFYELDSLITLHQRELDSLKKMKKSLLQMMFV